MIEEYLVSHWKKLERQKDKPNKRNSKIPLPYPYIVSESGSNDLSYWDSSFKILGLIESNRLDLVEKMANNFRLRINSFGHIPTGNRTYLLFRSQLPFYSLMIILLIHHKGPTVISIYMSSLIKEYNFWMRGIHKLENENRPKNRVVKIGVLSFSIDTSILWTHPEKKGIEKIGK